MIVRRVTVVLALTLAALLAACSSSSSGSGGSPAHTGSGRAGVGAVTDKAFLSVVHDTARGAPDHLMVTLAHDLCSDLRAGQSWVSQIAILIHQAHMSGYHAGQFTGAAIAAYCPDQASKTP